MDIQRGQRFKLKDCIDIDRIFDISFNISGLSVYDISCFGLDENDKLSDERYMIFYNQKNSPENAVSMEQLKCSIFHINLSELSSQVKKLSFTVSIDGNGIMGEIDSCIIQLISNNKEIAALKLYGKDFSKEKAVIAFEIYNKDGWKFNAVARGFDGGLSELLKLYGGKEADTNAETNKKISLEKKLENNAPKLVSLAKPIMITLEKNKLLGITARVGLVLDISGSMAERYKNGTVQLIVDKIVPLAVQFDDNGELDFWYYGTHSKRMKNVTLNNYESAVPNDWKGLRKSLGGSNYEPEAMRLIIEEYKMSNVPAYVIFITDGGVGSEVEIKQLIKDSSNYPIFWQFVGVGGTGYGILKKLDTLEGRTVDNASFFALDDFKLVPNQELYDRLLNEFPNWLKEAKSHNII